MKCISNARNYHIYKFTSNIHRCCWMDHFLPSNLLGMENFYSEGHSTDPSLIPSMTSWGSIPSTVQPTDWAVPRISFITPENSLAIDLGLITLAAPMISSMVMSPLCLMFLTFFLSLGGSFRALMIKAAADGTTETVACLFWILS